MQLRLVKELILYFLNNEKAIKKTTNGQVIIMVELHTMLFLSIFVLGDDFWDKLRSLLVPGAKAQFLKKEQDKM